MRRVSRLLLALVLSSAILTSSLIPFTTAAAHQADGQEYTVRTGDTLTKIASASYGDARLWPTIVDATNTKAASDPRFARITNPNIIRVGQLLWIPNQTAAGTVPVPITDPNALNEAYARAVSDAALADPDEISRNLVAITEWEPKLSWDDKNGQKRVLMVTWTSWTGYNDKVGQATTLDANRVVWVTAVPFVREFCQSYAHANPSLDRDLRLRQLLGLPPLTRKRALWNFGSTRTIYSAQRPTRRSLITRPSWTSARLTR